VARYDVFPLLWWLCPNFTSLMSVAGDRGKWPGGVVWGIDFTECSHKLLSRLVGWRPACLTNGGAICICPCVNVAWPRPTIALHLTSLDLVDRIMAFLLTPAKIYRFTFQKSRKELKISSNNPWFEWFYHNYNNFVTRVHANSYIVFIFLVSSFVARQWLFTRFMEDEDSINIFFSFARN
jgi:hypothetical protein